MRRDYLLTSVTKPSETELQQAILCFVDDKTDTSGEESWNAAMAIIGQACSMLDDGNTTAEVITSLAEQGLSEECSASFVEKANEIVQSANNRDVDEGARGRRAAQRLVKIAMVASLILALLVLTYRQ